MSFYSTGNTRFLANATQAVVGGPLIEAKTVEAYLENNRVTTPRFKTKVKRVDVTRIF